MSSGSQILCPSLHGWESAPLVKWWRLSHFLFDVTRRHHVLVGLVLSIFLHIKVLYFTKGNSWVSEREHSYSRTGLVSLTPSCQRRFPLHVSQLRWKRHPDSQLVNDLAFPHPVLFLNVWLWSAHKGVNGRVAPYRCSSVSMQTLLKVMQMIFFLSWVWFNSRRKQKMFVWSFMMIVVNKWVNNLMKNSHTLVVLHLLLNIFACDHRDVLFSCFRLASHSFPFPYTLCLDVLQTCLYICSESVGQ